MKFNILAGLVGNQINTLGGSSLVKFRIHGGNVYTLVGFGTIGDHIASAPNRAETRLLHFETENHQDIFAVHDFAMANRFPLGIVRLTGLIHSQVSSLRWVINGEDLCYNGLRYG